LKVKIISPRILRIVISRSNKTSPSQEISFKERKHTLIRGQTNLCKKIIKKQLKHLSANERSRIHAGDSVLKKLHPQKHLYKPSFKARPYLSLVQTQAIQRISEQALAINWNHFSTQKNS